MPPPMVLSTHLRPLFGRVARRSVPGTQDVRRGRFRRSTGDGLTRLRSPPCGPRPCSRPPSPACRRPAIVRSIPAWRALAGSPRRSNDQPSRFAHSVGVLAHAAALAAESPPDLARSPSPRPPILQLACLLHDVGRALDPGDHAPARASSGPTSSSDAGLPDVAPPRGPPLRGAVRGLARDMSHLDRWGRPDPTCSLCAHLLRSDHQPRPARHITVEERRADLLRPLPAGSIRVVSFDLAAADAERGRKLATTHDIGAPADPRTGSVSSSPMSVVKINAINVPEGMGPELERRFAERAKVVETMPGFEGFELLRPTGGETRYFVYTRWDSEESFSELDGERAVPPRPLASRQCRRPTRRPRRRPPLLRGRPNALTQRPVWPKPPPRLSPSSAAVSCQDDGSAPGAPRVERCDRRAAVRHRGSGSVFTRITLSSSR